MSPLVDGLAAALGVVVAVLAPIAAAAVDGRDRDGARAPLVIAARRAMLPAGALAAIALWLPAGAGATLLTLPYAIACGLLGLHGLGRIAARGRAIPRRSPPPVGWCCGRAARCGSSRTAPASTCSATRRCGSA
jgi:hypothetical protein